MALKRPIVIGAGVALILWLMSKDAKADAPEKSVEFTGTFGEGHDLGVDTTLSLKPLTMNPAPIPEPTETGIIFEGVKKTSGGADSCATGFGSISCVELDKRINESYEGGNIGNENYG